MIFAYFTQVRTFEKKKKVVRRNIIEFCMGLVVLLLLIKEGVVWGLSVSSFFPFVLQKSRPEVCDFCLFCTGPDL